ncbi:unnamed protein product [Rotaria sordida]|uniref:Uncharacterized protein n=1 Tax=Rotaria sordida TaxID=392033 RepID=A0A820E7J9_9BILA|nr:unnamed protein product [Rotaria sordida]CAF0965267.1 unnamed protein product [Rotaria sordida]CAF3758943.1 unnamed protein product [Rotaria sordida]CAF4242082.1 unnamed protein product [Rotaria sordida]
MIKALSLTDETRFPCLAHHLHQSYEQLLILLRELGEQHRLVHINPQLLYEISKLMENFSLIFDTVIKCMNINKKMKEDPFATMRGARTTTSSVTVSTNSNL